MGVANTLAPITLYHHMYWLQYQYDYVVRLVRPISLTLPDLVYQNIFDYISNLKKSYTDALNYLLMCEQFILH